MHSTQKIFFATILLLIAYSCAENKKPRKIAEWYEKIETEILNNSNQTADSISYSTNGSILNKTFFLNGKKLREEHYSLDTSRLYAITRFGDIDLFELRTEIHKNGQKATEG